MLSAPCQCHWCRDNDKLIFNSQLTATPHTAMAGLVSMSAVSEEIESWLCWHRGLSQIINTKILWSQWHPCSPPSTAAGLMLYLIWGGVPWPWQLYTCSPLWHKAALSSAQLSSGVIYPAHCHSLNELLQPVEPVLRGFPSLRVCQQQQRGECGAMCHMCQCCYSLAWSHSASTLPLPV